MRIGQQVKFLPVDMKASSLHSLIAGGVFQETSLGRDKWKSLIGSDASLQTGCNREGFNAVASQSVSAKARIGILGNDQGDCATCDSRIGFGTGGHTDDSNICGDNTPNGFTSDNGGKNIKAMGYILVQQRQRKRLKKKKKKGGGQENTGRQDERLSFSLGYGSTF